MQISFGRGNLVLLNLFLWLPESLTTNRPPSSMGAFFQCGGCEEYFNLYTMAAFFEYNLTFYNMSIMFKLFNLT